MMPSSVTAPSICGKPATNDAPWQVPTPLPFGQSLSVAHGCPAFVLPLLQLPLSFGGLASRSVQLNGVPLMAVRQLLLPVQKPVPMVPPDTGEYICWPATLLASMPLPEAIAVVVGMVEASPCEAGGSSAVHGTPSYPLAAFTGRQMFWPPHSPATPVHFCP